MTQAILLTTNGPVATLTLNRPDQRNPLGEVEDAPLFEAAIAQINGDKSIRCVILTGAGSAFSAGGNVKAMRDKAEMFRGNPADIRQGYRTNIHRALKSIWNIEVPVIAAVNGPAIGAGCDLSLLADLRIAGQGAKFGVTFLKLGLVPGDGGAWLLPRAIGPARAAELFYTGDVIRADQALDWGLVSRVVPDEELMDVAQSLAGRIAAQPPDVLRLTKTLMRKGQTSTYEDVLDMSAAFQALAHHTQDHHEAVSAFFDKRPPEFSGQ